MTRQARAFGVEEEYLLLDSVTGAPVNRAAQVALAADLGAQTEREYLSSQLETATPICRAADEAEVILAGFRRVVGRAARDCGAVLAGTGVPPVGGDATGTVTPKQRYLRIETEIRGVAEHHYSTGTHVHVEIPSPDAGVEVLARLARWAPALLAMGANSPLWCGERTGFASWRHILGLSWPVPGYPQTMVNGEEYLRAVQKLIDTGAILDPGLISWVARLSANYPTIEVRIADAQLSAEDAVSFAAIVRALVERALRDTDEGKDRPCFSPGLVNGADWLAARNGLGSDLIDPLAEQSLPAFDFVDRMLASIEFELREFGDRDRVERYVGRLRSDCGPAARQLAAFDGGGIERLLSLYSAGR